MKRGQVHPAHRRRDRPFTAGHVSGDCVLVTCNRLVEPAHPVQRHGGVVVAVGGLVDVARSEEELLGCVGRGQCVVYIAAVEEVLPEVAEGMGATGALLLGHVFPEGRQYVVCVV